MMDNHLTVNIASARNAIIMYHHKVFFYYKWKTTKKDFQEIILKKINQLILTRQHPLTCRTFRDHQHQFSRFNPTIFIIINF